MGYCLVYSIDSIMNKDIVKFKVPGASTDVEAVIVTISPDRSCACVFSCGEHLPIQMSWITEVRRWSKVRQKCELVR